MIQHNSMGAISMNHPSPKVRAAAPVPREASRTPDVDRGSWPNGSSPLLLTVAQTQRLLGIGKTSVFQMLDTGQLERRKLGRATRVTFRSVLHVAGLDEPAPSEIENASEL